MAHIFSRICLITVVLFTVATSGTYGQSVKPTVNGALSASLTSYEASGIDSNREPLSYLVRGSLNIKAGPIAVPISAVVSRQQKDVSAVFSRFGMSPSWGWGKAHLGYRSLTFSDYTLGGSTFLGAGVELNPSLLRFSAVYGRFQKARQEDLDLRIIPRYKRSGFGLKLGVGTDRNHVDFIYFGAQDDTLSLENAPTDLDITPKENVVLGIAGRITPVSQLSLFWEVAASALNRDIRSPELDTQIPSLVTSIFTPRESVQANLATRLGADVNIDRFGVRLEYKRIDPDYQTLGSYFFDTDVESITVAPRATLWNRRLNVSLSTGFARNNLYDDLAQTTSRVIVSSNVSARLTDGLSVAAQYGNYSSSQSEGYVETSDSLRVRNVSRNFSITPRYQIRRKDTRHLLSLRLAIQDFLQENDLTGVVSESNSANGNLAYSIAFSGKDLQLRASGTYLKSTVGTRESTSRSISLHASKTLTRQNLSIEAQTGYRTRKSGGTDAAGTLFVNLGLTFTPSRFDSISLQSQLGGRLTDPVRQDGYSELLTTVTYTRRF